MDEPDARQDFIESIDGLTNENRARYERLRRAARWSDLTSGVVILWCVVFGALSLFHFEQHVFGVIEFLLVVVLAGLVWRRHRSMRELRVEVETLEGARDSLVSIVAELQASDEGGE